MLLRSFSRRIGKSLSTLQKTLLDTELPKHLLTNELLTNANGREIFLEIGFGMGEHFVRQAALKPEALFIGTEVYLNGVANVLKMAAEQNITNFLLSPDDLDSIIDYIPEGVLSGIYILFPDPWPKRRQQKKRIFSPTRVEILSKKLKNAGFLVFASDINDYFQEAKKILMLNGKFKILSEEPPKNYIETKYHKKALNYGRTPKFFQAFITNDLEQVPD